MKSAKFLGDNGYKQQLKEFMAGCQPKANTGTN
jgi:hypothetical protein